MKPSEDWPALTVFCAIGTTITECDREALQGSSIILGTSTTAVAMTDNDINIQVNETIQYVESLSYEELEEFDKRLTELEAQFEMPEIKERPKIFTKL